MPDTDRYRQWVALLAASDRVLVQLVAIAAGAVLAWELLRRLPQPWQGRARLLYLAVGLGTLLTALRGQLSWLALVVLAACIGAGAMLTRGIVDRRRRVAGSSPTKGL